MGYPGDDGGTRRTPGPESRALGRGPRPGVARARPRRRPAAGTGPVQDVWAPAAAPGPPRQPTAPLIRTPVPASRHVRRSREAPRPRARPAGPGHAPACSRAKPRSPGGADPRPAGTPGGDRDRAPRAARRRRRPRAAVRPSRTAPPPAHENAWRRPPRGAAGDEIQGGTRPPGRSGTGRRPADRCGARARSGRPGQAAAARSAATRRPPGHLTRCTRRASSRRGTRPELRTAAGRPGHSAGLGPDLAEPGYSQLAVSDPAADATATQTWAVLDEADAGRRVDQPAGRSRPARRTRRTRPGARRSPAAASRTAARRPARRRGPGRPAGRRQPPRPARHRARPGRPARPAPGPSPARLSRCAGRAPARRPAGRPAQPRGGHGRGPGHRQGTGGDVTEPGYRRVRHRRLRHWTAPAPAASDTTGLRQPRHGRIRHRRVRHRRDSGTGGFDTGGFDTGEFDTGGFDTGGFDTGGFGTGGFGTGGFEAATGTGGFGAPAEPGRRAGRDASPAGPPPRGSRSAARGRTPRKPRKPVSRVRMWLMPAGMLVLVGALITVVYLQFGTRHSGTTSAASATRHPAAAASSAPPRAVEAHHHPAGRPDGADPGRAVPGPVHARAPRSAVRTAQRASGRQLRQDGARRQAAGRAAQGRLHPGDAGQLPVHRAEDHGHHRRAQPGQRDRLGAGRQGDRRHRVHQAAARREGADPQPDEGHRPGGSRDQGPLPDPDLGRVHQPQGAGQARSSGRSWTPSPARWSAAPRTSA